VWGGVRQGRARCACRIGGEGYVRRVTEGGRRACCCCVGSRLCRPTSDSDALAFLYLTSKPKSKSENSHYRTHSYSTYPLPPQKPAQGPYTRNSFPGHYNPTLQFFSAYIEQFLADIGEPIGFREESGRLHYRCGGRGRRIRGLCLRQKAVRIRPYRDCASELVIAG
jgi:hypothetical protein